MNAYQRNSNKRKLLTVIAINIAVTTSIMVTSGGSIMLPIAAEEIGGAELWPLALNISGVFGLILMVLYGYMISRKPHIKPTLFILSMLVAASVIVVRGLAPNMWVIVIPAFFLGIYSPAIYVLGFSMLREMNDIETAGTQLGLTTAFRSIGNLIGPVLVGSLIQLSGWRAPNFVIAGLFIASALCMILGVRVKKSDTQDMVQSGGKFDAQGTIAIVLFLAPLILALSLGSHAPFGSFQNVFLFILSAIGIIWLVIIIRKKKEQAIIPLPVLKDKNTLCFFSANFFAICAGMAFPIFIPSYIMYVLNQSPTVSALAISVYSIAGIFMGPILGKMIGKTGSARNVGIWGNGALRLIIFIAFLIFVGPEKPTWIVYMLMFISGFYSASSSAFSAVGPQIQLREDIRLLGNAFIQLGQNFGGAIGIAVYTAVIASLGLAEGFRVVLMIASAFSVLVMIFSAPLKKI